MPNILQFKLTLKHSSPKIWRQFQIPDNFTFHDLHLVVQGVMGWDNSHLYQFVLGKNNYIGDTELLENDEITEANETELVAIFDKPKAKIV